MDFGLNRVIDVATYIVYATIIGIIVSNKNSVELVKAVSGGFSDSLRAAQGR